MAKKKYYAVAKGRLPGIYTTWDDCKAQVEGYSGAAYKSFTAEEDAIKYLKDNGVPVKEKPKAIKKEDTIPQGRGFKYCPKVKSSTKTEKGAIRSKANVRVLHDYLDPENIFFINPNAFIAFVDGSYDKDTKVYGSGVCILLNGENPQDYTDGVITAGIDIWDQWNIVGELEATKLAINTAYLRGFDNVFIYHDLKNISLWASGEWQAKNEYTQDYVRFIEKMSKEINIQFIKVKGHSGNKYNDMADGLAEFAIREYKEEM